MNAELHTTVVLLFVALAISLVGNLLVIISALVNRELRNNTGLLIMNLAISDLCITCFSLPLRLCQILGWNWSDDFTSCGITVSFTIFFFTASNFNLFLVTMDRFLGVLWPIRYRIRVSKRKINVVICCSWLLACFIAFFPKFAIGEQENDSITKLNFICMFGTVLHPGYLIFMEVFTLFIPWTLMIVMYSAIVRTVFKSATNNSSHKSQSRREHNTNTNANANTNTSLTSNRRAKEIKLAKGVLVIVIIYSVLMVPIAVIDLLGLIGGIQVPLSAIRITVLMAYLNPAVNPPVYAATSKKYKDTFARIFTCRRIINSTLGLLSSKVVSLNDQFRYRKEAKRRHRFPDSSSIAPPCSSTDSHDISGAPFHKQQGKLMQGPQVRPPKGSESVVPIFTITEEVEIPFVRPVQVNFSSEIEDLTEQILEEKQQNPQLQNEKLN
eukprot:gene2974-3428_t